LNCCAKYSSGASVLSLGVSFSLPILETVGIENPGHLVKVSFLLYMIQPAHTLGSCPFGGLDFSDRVYAFACNPSTFVLGGTIYILASAKPYHYLRPGLLANPRSTKSR
jgi:hypothetical protein